MSSLKTVLTKPFLFSAETSRYFAMFKEIPVPAQYAHPATLDRMIRVIREGKAESVGKAYEVMKEELRAINNQVTVSQTEYDEIVAIKPMFLLCGYRDDLAETA